MKKEHFHASGSTDADRCTERLRRQLLFRFFGFPASGNDSGVSGAITVISREDGSGTRGAFIELTGVEEKNDAGEKIDNTTADAEIANKTDVVLTSVAGNEKAIGYISLGAPERHRKGCQGRRRRSYRR